ncbi:response regulator [Pseudoruegeria sp. SK021]|uniref:response regulator n=1 Tax=Pseudoruegeria sp. SK021 TaxID=1933035 RepID=UPI000A22A6DC|nr:response regulator [Pseudoruegeria sp. SK021]OSP51933.1 hypothetical protein BV911_18840 [Pseudoruegeria sp. SK021]
MPVLIVESNPELGELWKRHLERLGMTVFRVETDTAAIHTLRERQVRIIVLNVVLKDGGAFAVADYANYRYPKMKVIFVSSSSFFTDGSIFTLAGNACAYLPSSTPPDDLAAMVEYHAARD